MQINYSHTKKTLQITGEMFMRKKYSMVLSISLLLVLSLSLMGCAITTDIKDQILYEE